MLPVEVRALEFWVIFAPVAVREVSGVELPTAPNEMFPKAPAVSVNAAAPSIEPPNEILPPLPEFVSTVQPPNRVTGEAVVIVKALQLIFELMLTALAVVLALVIVKLPKRVVPPTTPENVTEPPVPARKVRPVIPAEMALIVLENEMFPPAAADPELVASTVVVAPKVTGPVMVIAPPVVVTVLFKVIPPPEPLACNVTPSPEPLVTRAPFTEIVPPAPGERMRIGSVNV